MWWERALTAACPQLYPSDPAAPATTDVPLASRRLVEAVEHVVEMRIEAVRVVPVLVVAVATLAAQPVADATQCTLLQRRRPVTLEVAQLPCLAQLAEEIAPVQGTVRPTGQRVCAEHAECL